jgi:peptidoglycan L-alanyl-D-glutamate endopeptidase CwlK
MRKYSSVDFGVGDHAVRTEQQQRGFVSKKLSRTVDSKHLRQKDGYSHAVDLYPVGYNANNPKKTKDQFEAITYAMNMAAFDLGIRLDGGFNWKWDYPHFQIDAIFNTKVEAIKG